MPRLTEAQQRERTGYLGASDVAVIAGVSPWKTPFELYLEKIGELDPEVRQSTSDRDRRERGHRLEDVALDWDAELRGLSIERIRRDVVHPRMPFVVVHPDARAKPWRSTRKLLEAKTSARKWDEIPQHVEAQVQMQMAATGADVVDVVVLGFDGPPTPWPVERNDELIGGLEELAAAFWSRVERRDPPPLDGSRAASHWLDRLFREGPEQVADPSQADALVRLLDIRDEVKRLEAEDDAIVNALKFSMAGGSRMYARGVGKVVWTAPGERRTVAWKEVAAGYRKRLEEVVIRAGMDPDDARMALEELDTLESLYTRLESGIRQFRITPAKGEERVA